MGDTVWNDAFKDRLAAALGWLHDGGELPPNHLHNVLDYINLKNTGEFFNRAPDAPPMQVGYAGRLLGNLLLIKNYLDSQKEADSFTSFRGAPKSIGHTKFDAFVDDYIALLRSEFKKLPDADRDRTVQMFSAYAAERSRLMLAYIQDQELKLSNTKTVAPVKIAGLDIAAVQLFKSKLHVVAEKGQELDNSGILRSRAIETLLTLPREREAGDSEHLFVHREERRSLSRIDDGGLSTGR